MARNKQYPSKAESQASIDEVLEKARELVGQLSPEEQEEVLSAVRRFRKPPNEFTDDRKAKFLVMYRASGLLYKSAAFAGVCGQTVKNHQASDAEFKEICDQVLQERLDELEGAAFSRAVHGVEEPIIGGKDRDEVVTTVRRYSDSLTTFLLRGKRAEFRDKVDVNAKVTGGVLVIPAAPRSADEWEAEMGEKARGQTGRDD